MRTKTTSNPILYVPTTTWAQEQKERELVAEEQAQCIINHNHDQLSIFQNAHDFESMND